MSGHADTIREALYRDPDAAEGWPALAALDALVTENQRLRDALERITRWDYSEGADNNALSIARAALAGTPSKDTA
jgi:hypothetical protein